MRTYIVKSLFIEGLGEEINYDQAYFKINREKNCKWTIDVEYPGPKDYFIMAAYYDKEVEVTFSTIYATGIKGIAEVKKVQANSNYVQLSGIELL
ncbi:MULTISPECIES: hypothetical protein [Bacillus cereus group]|uniref:Uncharacterized protein n=1 Tax=Bacillus cereus TaxID=1396 RepID=A0A2A8TZD9_BACCE|nr:hypothetical protein [Bacillus cereus]PDY80622.1 hypothetical protein CON06_20265 [Bacillus cereus]PFA09376.1 hypothetical protein CN382_22355 [Bacillus cereus]PFM41452.1 hypothetical protein COJ43_10350 [Bacillus cereus]PGL64680.1 hypothetical protein CN927_01935 [Bacillus cereus]PGQ05357.1 hypothetical protein COA08_27450 [Bacillus cereus]